MENFDFNSIPIPKTFIRFKKIFQKGKIECVRVQISGENGSHTMDISETTALFVGRDEYAIQFNGDIATQVEDIFVIDGTFTFMPKHEN